MMGKAKLHLYAAVGVAAAAAIAGPAFGETHDWIEFHFDKKPHAPHELMPGLRAGLEATLTVDTERNFNIDKSDNEDESVFSPELQLNLIYDDGGLVRTYAEFEISRDIILESPDDDRPSTKLAVDQLFLTLFNENRNFGATVGRFGVSDEREWLFDEDLDGGQFVWRGETDALEFMYAREEIVRKDILGEDRNDNPDWFLSRYYGQIAKDTIASVYMLHGHWNDGSDTALTWAGLSLTGKWGGDTEYCLEAAGVFGDEDGRKVAGYGADAGVTHTFSDVAMEPRFTFAAAFGSGDDGVGTDTAFRQTGLQGNSSRFGGRTSFKYYGEVFDPELSNLAVLTLGAGVSLADKTSLDLVYHHFRQVTARDFIRDSSIDEDPTSDSTHLGDEIDLVLGIREIDNVDIDLVGGIFIPGGAFPDSTGNAIFGELEVSFSF